MISLCLMLVIYMTPYDTREVGNSYSTSLMTPVWHQWGLLVSGSTLALTVRDTRDVCHSYCIIDVRLTPVWHISSKCHLLSLCLDTCHHLNTTEVKNMVFVTIRDLTEVRSIWLTNDTHLTPAASTSKVRNMWLTPDTWLSFDTREAINIQT